MKKILLVLLCSILLIGFTGCGKEKEEAPINEPKKDKNNDVISKINLNDEVYVYQFEHNLLCGGYSYPTNLNNFKTDNKPLFITEYNGYLDKLIFDEEQEKNVHEKLSKIEPPKQVVFDFTFDFKDHIFSYKFYSIKLYDNDKKADIDKNSKYYDTSLKIDKEVAEFKQKLADIFVSSNAELVMGSCMIDDINPVMLDEKLCEKYNLDCGRW